MSRSPKSGGVVDADGIILEKIKEKKRQRVSHCRHLRSRPKHKRGPWTEDNDSGEGKAKQLEQVVSELHLQD